METLTKVNNPTAKRGFQRAALIISIVCFALVFALLLVAVISDIAIFSKQLLTFAVAILGAAAAFMIGFILMVLSCMLIFGVYLIEKSGFWPLNWAKQAFSEIIKDAQITSEQIGVLVGVRIALLICCILIFVSAIVALVFASIAKRQNKNIGIKIRQGSTKAFSIISLVLSVFGFFVALIVLLLVAVLTI